MREGWAKAALGELTNITKGSSPTLKTVPGQYPLIVTGPKPLSSDAFQFDGEAVCVPLVSSTGHGHASLKRVHYAAGRFAVANILAACEVRDPQLLSTRYLFHFLQHRKDDLIVSRMKGTANVSLSIGRLAEVPVTFPPLDEQKRIVDLIAAMDDAIQAAVAEAESAFQALEEIRDQLIWGKDVPRAPLSDLCAISGSLVALSSPAARALPHIGTERIVSKTGDLEGVVSAAEDAVTSAKFVHSAGDVIYAKIRPNLRKVAIPDWDGLASADAYPLRPLNGGDASFLRHLLISRPFTRLAVEKSGRTKMPKINKSELMSIEVPQHGSSSQGTIAMTLDVLDGVRRAARDAATALRTLRANLLTVLLSGEHEIPLSYDRFLEDAA